MKGNSDLVYDITANDWIDGLLSVPIFSNEDDTEVFDGSYSTGRVDNFEQKCEEYV